MDKENVKQSFVNARQIFGLLSLIDENKDNPNASLKNVLSQFEERYKVNINDHYFCNQHTLIILLVTHLMTPKETFFETIPEISIKKLSNQWNIPSNVLTDITLKTLVRRMRNSICHANFEISEDLKISFIDINPRDNNDKLSIEFTSDEIFGFMRAFSYFILTNDVELLNLK